MNQQINLYQIEKKKPDRRITFSQVSIGVCGYLVFLVLMAVHDLYGYVVTKIEVSSLEKKQLQRKEVLDSMLGEVEKQKANEKVLADLKEREGENDQKKKLLNTLETSDDKKIVRYSQYFESLARKKIENLWITKIIIKNDGSYLFMEGGCLKPTDIMQFISALKTEPAFAGKIFHLFNFSFDEKTNKATFSLETGN